MFFFLSLDPFSLLHRIPWIARIYCDFFWPSGFLWDMIRNLQLEIHCDIKCYRLFACCVWLVRLGHTRATCHMPHATRPEACPGCDARSCLDACSIFSLTLQIARHIGRTARSNENLWAALAAGLQCVREHSQWTRLGRQREGERERKRARACQGKSTCCQSQGRLAFVTT